MLRLLSFLFSAMTGASGVLVVDYTVVRSAADAGGAAPPTFENYLDALPDRLANLTDRSGGMDQTWTLVRMLPKPPEGWTVRTATAEDVGAFLPEHRRDGDALARDLVAGMVGTDVGHGAALAVLTYENGSRKVIIRAVRYPDAFFTDPARVAPDARQAGFPGLAAFTVRGLDVTEDMLPGAFRARFFAAEVGGQIHLSILTPKRMQDAEVATFLQTLNVAALNALVVDRQDGLGEVPLIVIASALSDADRQLYQAARARREASRESLAAWLHDAGAGLVLASDAPLPAAGQPTMAECTTRAGGVHRCRVSR